MKKTDWQRGDEFAKKAVKGLIQVCAGDGRDDFIMWEYLRFAYMSGMRSERRRNRKEKKNAEQ